ncbi:AAA family ATPase [Waterburya agarophytonicola K14]|uniref:Nuclease SbcCD subunit C n=1 Tax=Waterburya agarophytonicola KI4 TaxID=2874699 RepID=A0A964BSV5_9CYAN|nr:AAA family ATPase [Waterburya agarophytonicola]MCC0177542.1 AAA family ATPase [Waterburya agarophytonicola KI4]
MRLIHLQLCNFRQFYSKTPQIQFAWGERNTTVIYGNNGAGKTTILNAFTWVLYEKFTAAFASPELLVNQRAITEANLEQAVECWVELQFEHDRKLYQIKRKCYANKISETQVKYSPTKLFMLVAGDDGRWYPALEAAEDIIERILPASLHQYFFFDGERIDSFFRHNQNHNIAEDTKELLGVKILDRAIDHLKKAKRTLQEELQELGDARTKELLSKQIKLEQEGEELIASHQKNIATLKQLEQQKVNLSRQLLDISGADKIQQLKAKLVSQQKNLQKDLIQNKIKLKKILSQASYTVFLGGMSDRFLKLLQNLRDRGQLSSGVKQEFIEQLLNRQSCLCGTSLIPNTDGYNNVKAWLKKVELKNIEESAIRLETQVAKIEDNTNDFWQQLDLQQAAINHQYLALNRLESEIIQANKQLQTYPDRDIQKLQQKIEQIETKIKTSILEQGINQQQQSDRAEKLQKLVKQITQHQLTETKQKIAQKRINATQESIARLNKVRTRLEQQFRLALEQKVQEIFSFISFTPYLPKLSPSYELTLVQNILGTEVLVAASTGENQILSLSFIGGIIDRVRQWSQRNTLVGYDSSTFPIVMDSPFGSLDQIYRRQVAKAIPELANQLVIFATKTQWRGEVETETKSRIGRKYVLTYYSPKIDCEPDWLDLERQNYPLVRHSLNNFEYTEIVTVES